MDRGRTDARGARRAARRLRPRRGRARRARAGRGVPRPRPRSAGTRSTSYRETAALLHRRPRGAARGSLAPHRGRARDEPPGRASRSVVADRRPPLDGPAVAAGSQARVAAAIAAAARRGGDHRVRGERSRSSQQEDRLDAARRRASTPSGGTRGAQRNAAMADPQRTRVDLHADEAGSTRAKVVTCRTARGSSGRRHARLVPGRMYQLWALVGDRRSRRWISAGRARARSRRRRVPRPGPIVGFMVTEEVEPGVECRRTPTAVLEGHSKLTPLRGRSRLRAGPWSRWPFGVYVHIPFCASRCDYCDFATWTDRAHLDRRLRRRVRRSTSSGAPRRRAPAATSVFFGGGTPSLLDGAAARRDPRRDPAGRRRRGHRRVQPRLGRRREARALPSGRRQSAVVRRAVDAPARAGVARPHPRSRERAAGGRAARATRASTRVNLDLIYGTPGESADDWRATLDAALALEPPHVSAYALTVEPARRSDGGRGGGSRGPDDDDQATKYESPTTASARRARLVRGLELGAPGRGVPPQPPLLGQGEYAGIGCAAHGHDRTGRRWWNVRTPERYIERVEAGDDPEAGPRTGSTRGPRVATQARAEREAPRSGLRTRDEAVRIELEAPRRASVGVRRWPSSARSRLLATEVDEPRLLTRRGPPAGQRGHRRALAGALEQPGAPAVGTR